MYAHNALLLQMHYEEAAFTMIPEQIRAHSLVWIHCPQFELHSYIFIILYMSLCFIV